MLFTDVKKGLPALVLEILAHNYPSATKNLNLLLCIKQFVFGLGSAVPGPKSCCGNLAVLDRFKDKAVQTSLLLLISKQKLRIMRGQIYKQPTIDRCLHHYQASFLFNFELRLLYV